MHCLNLQGCLERVRQSPVSLVYISNHIHIRWHWKNALFIKKEPKEKVLLMEDDQKEELKNQVEEYKKSKFELEERVFELTSKVADLTKDHQNYQKDSDRLRELYEADVVMKMAILSMVKLKLIVS